MKKLHIAIIVLCISLLVGCDKETEMGSNIIPKSLEMNPELTKLYEQMPNFDFGTINVLNNNILQFESREHYTRAYNALSEQYETWSNIFFGKYEMEDEEALDSLIDELGFDDCTPLLLFEENYGIMGRNLRTVNVVKENEWLSKGAEGTRDFGNIITCPVEQTFFSKHFEICIDDTIYHLGFDDYAVLIPIAQLKNINEIRKKPIKELQKDPNLKVLELRSKDGCYKSKHYKSGECHHTNKAKFTWSYDYRYRADLAALIFTCTMENYEYIYVRKNKRYEWKKRPAVCAIGMSADLYQTNLSYSDCAFVLNPTINLGAAHRHKSHSKQCGVFQSHFMHNIRYTRNNTNDSYILCRHNGWTYKFNAETGLPM